MVPRCAPCPAPPQCLAAAAAAALARPPQMLLARSPEARAAIDVQFHFSASLLREQDPETGETRQQQLVHEYVEAAAAAAAPQPAHGMRGQLAAVVRHRVRRRDVRAMQSGAFPILVSCACMPGRCVWGAPGGPARLPAASASTLSLPPAVRVRQRAGKGSSGTVQPAHLPSLPHLPALCCCCCCLLPAAGDARERGRDCAAALWPPAGGAARRSLPGAARRPLCDAGAGGECGVGCVCVRVRAHVCSEGRQGIWQQQIRAEVRCNPAGSASLCCPPSACLRTFLPKLPPARPPTHLSVCLPACLTACPGSPAPPPACLPACRRRPSTRCCAPSYWATAS